MNPAEEKAFVVQHDHNSERITFEVPRYVEEHDLSLCNVVQIHYLNVEAGRKDRYYAGIYEVDDMQISPDDDGVVICSWLVSGSATQYAGSLNFVVRFSCVSEDGTIDYAWNTTICSDLSVSAGMWNTDVFVEEHSDIFAEWEARIKALEENGGASVELDTTLTEEGKAADAKAVGDALAKLSDEEPEDVSGIPKLTQTQKSEIQALANAYYNGRTNFYYDYNIVRNDLANNRCWNSHDSASNQFGMCCNVFVELLWMGRAATDFLGKNGASYSNAITKAFDWGYMFNFADRRTLAGAAKRDENGKIECDSDGNPTGYYNLVNPNGDYTWAYSTNTYYDTDVSNEEKYPARQWFHSFMTADCVAQELYRMGCEIPYDELDVGDLVFTKKRWKDNTEYDTYRNDLRWRKISHVLMVLEKDDDGTLKFIDCTYRLPGKPFLKCSVKSEDKWDAARAVEVIGNVAMCARHPAAFGKSNMSDIERIDYLPMCYQSGFSTGQAIPFAPGKVVTEGLWYTYNNDFGVALATGVAAVWDSTYFDIQHTNAVKAV